MITWTHKGQTYTQSLTQAERERPRLKDRIEAARLELDDPDVTETDIVFAGVTHTDVTQTALDALDASFLDQVAQAKVQDPYSLRGIIATPESL